MFAGVVFGEDYKVVNIWQGLLDDLVFFLFCDLLNDLLDGVSPILVAWNVDQLLTLNFPQNSDPLMVLEFRDEVLAEEVSVVVGHEIWKLVLDLFDDLVDKRLLGRLDEVLQE